MEVVVDILHSSTLKFLSAELAIGGCKNILSHL